MKCLSQPSTWPRQHRRKRWWDTAGLEPHAVEMKHWKVTDEGQRSFSWWWTSSKVVFVPCWSKICLWESPRHFVQSRQYFVDCYQRWPKLKVTLQMGTMQYGGLVAMWSLRDDESDRGVLVTITCTLDLQDLLRTQKSKRLSIKCCVCSVLKYVRLNKIYCWC
jgi:hypothetical protein